MVTTLGCVISTGRRELNARQNAKPDVARLALPLAACLLLLIDQLVNAQRLSNQSVKFACVQQAPPWRMSFE